MIMVTIVMVMVMMKVTKTIKVKWEKKRTNAKIQVTALTMMNNNNNNNNLVLTIMMMMMMIIMSRTVNRTRTMPQMRCYVRFQVWTTLITVDIVVIPHPGLNNATLVYPPCCTPTPQKASIRRTLTPHHITHPVYKPLPMHHHHQQQQQYHHLHHSNFSQAIKLVSVACLHTLLILEIVIKSVETFYLHHR